MRLTVKVCVALLLSASALAVACTSSVAPANIATLVPVSSGNETIGSAGVVSPSFANYDVAPRITTFNTSSGQVAQGIGVVGVGTVKIEPDEAVVNFTVRVENSSAAGARDNAVRSKDTLVKAIVDQAVAEDDISSSFSLYSWRRWDSERNAAGEVVYNATFNVTVELREIANLGSLLDSVVDAVGNDTDIGGISYRSSRRAELINQARRNAVSDALARAQLYADALGVQLGQPLSLVESSSSGADIYRASDVYAIAPESSGISVEPGDVSFDASVQLVYSIVPTGN